jgi:hypothetical protein
MCFIRVVWADGLGVNGKVTNKKALQIEDDIGRDENVVPYVAKI